MDFLLAETENNISLFNNYALVVTSAAILVTMILALIRAMLGPTVFDRVLALNMFGTKTVWVHCTHTHETSTYV